MSGSPRIREIMEIREHFEKKFHTWKNQGILFFSQNQGKIREFCKDVEKYQGKIREFCKDVEFVISRCKILDNSYFNFCVFDLNHLFEIREKNYKSWKNQGKIREFRCQFSVGTLWDTPCSTLHMVDVSGCSTSHAVSHMWSPPAVNIPLHRTFCD